MSDQSEFDVFLAHHSGDKPFVREINRQLKQRGLKPWIDEEQIAPGRSFQEEIQKAIPIVKTAAIFIGREGLGRWQNWEVKMFVSECIENGTPVIPVLLPGVNKVPEDLRFLREYRWINFKNENDSRALESLEWGITNEKTPNDPSHSPDKPIPATAKSSKIKLSIGTAIVTFSLGVIVFIGTEWQNRQTEKETLEQAKTWQQQKKYDECVRSAASITQKSQIYAQAQNFVEQCSQELLEQARQRFTDTGKLTDDIKSQIELIPQDSPVGKESRDELAQWINGIHIAAATKAFRNCDWHMAATEGRQVNTHDEKDEDEKKQLRDLVNKAIKFQNATPLKCPFK